VNLLIFSINFKFFQNNFLKVFEPGRKLLHKGELLRYTRKTPKPRYLVLFSDYLLICKYPAIGDAFEKFHKIKVEDIQLNIKGIFKNIFIKKCSFKKRSC